VEEESVDVAFMVGAEVVDGHWSEMAGEDVGGD